MSSFASWFPRMENIIILREKNTPDRCIYIRNVLGEHRTRDSWSCCDARAADGKMMLRSQEVKQLGIYVCFC